MSNSSENAKAKQSSDSTNGIKKKNKKGRTLTFSEFLIGKQVIPQVYEKQAKRAIKNTENSKGGATDAQSKKQKENENLNTTTSVKESSLSSTSSDCRPLSRSHPIISRANGTDNWHVPKHGNHLRSTTAGSSINPNRSGYNTSWRNSETHSNSIGHENWNIAKERRQTSNYNIVQSSRPIPISSSSGYTRPLYAGGFSNRPWQQQPRNIAQPPCPPSQYRPLSNNWDDDDRNCRL